MDKIDKILREERFKLKIRQNARKAKIATGLALVLAGSTFGTIKAIDTHNMSENPIVQEYESACDDFAVARRKWESLPSYDRMMYTPQTQRQDYSDSQAHSETERVYQNLVFAESNFDELNSNPVVRDFVNTENSSWYGYALAGLGLFLGVKGLKRRESR